MKAGPRIFAVLLGCCTLTQPAGADEAAVPAANNPPATASDASAGNEVVARAVAAIEAHASVLARLRQRIELFDQQLLGSGTYVQGPAAEHRFRLELRLEGENQGSTLQHVSDGETLWIFRELDGKDARVSKVDLKRVLEALAKRDEAEPSQAPGSLSTVGGLGLGGLPKLLRGLSLDFQFGPPQAGTLGGLPVVVLRGVWQPARLAAFLPEQKDAILAGQAADLAALPAQVPEQVVLNLGRDDLFPYRIEYLRRREPGVLDRDAVELREIVVLEVFDVKLGAPIEKGQFTYQPDPEAKLPDDTEVYLRSLGF